MKAGSSQGPAFFGDVYPRSMVSFVSSHQAQPHLESVMTMTITRPDPFDIAPDNVLAYLFDRLPVGTAVIDREFRLRRFNPTWAEFIDRYTPSAAGDVVPGASLFDLEPGTEEVLIPLFAPVFAGQTVRQEGIRLESGGIVSYWDVVLVPLEVDGEVIAALNVSLDATAQVESRQALLETVIKLQDNEAHLRSMLESAKGYAIYRVAMDPDHPYLGRVVMVSPSIREVIGIEDPYDFTSWFAGVHPEDIERITAANQRALLDSQPFDETMRFFDGRRQEWRYVHTVSHPIFDDHRRVTYFNGLIIDVTDQKRAEETLAQLNQVLERQVTERTQEINRQRQVEKKRRLESERRQKVAESLRETLGVLNSGRPLPEILDYIVTTASQLMGAAICTLHHIDYKRAFVRIEASHGLPEALLDITGFPLLSSTADQRILNRQPVVRTYQRPPRPDPALENELDPRVWRWRQTLGTSHRSYLAVPLVVAGEVYGSLAFYFIEPRSFDQETVDLAMALGVQAALAIDNASLRLQAERAAVTDERNRLARELHDAVTQTLFSASLIADVLPRIYQRDAAMGQAKLEELRELTRGALAEMRTLLLELRPATLTESSLADLLRQLATAVVGRSRLKVDVQADGDRPLPPDTQVALYRIAQEALNNIVKHAGASRVAIRLCILPECVELLVADDGRGFDPERENPHSLGLGIMRERAARIGADLQIESVIGEGTTVRVYVCDEAE
jgi:PAS domain S-box-containing protein